MRIDYLYSFLNLFFLQIVQTVCLFSLSYYIIKNLNSLHSNYYFTFRISLLSSRCRARGTFSTAPWSPARTPRPSARRDKARKMVAAALTSSQSSAGFARSAPRQLCRCSRSKRCWCSREETSFSSSLFQFI